MAFDADRLAVVSSSLYRAGVLNRDCCISSPLPALLYLYPKDFLRLHRDESVTKVLFTSNTVNSEYFVRTKFSYPGDLQPFVRMKISYSR